MFLVVLCFSRVLGYLGGFKGPFSVILGLFRAFWVYSFEVSRVFLKVV